MKPKIQLFLSVLLILLLPACSGNANTDIDTDMDKDIAIAVALTQTAAALSSAAPSAPAEQPTATPLPPAPAEQPTATPLPPAPAPETIRIEFQPNTTSWEMNGDLAAGAAARYVLSAARGQQLNVWLYTDPASTGSSLNATLSISGADGQNLSSDPAAFWSGILPADQDYFVEVSSLAAQAITYQVSVEVPAVVIDPARGAVYEPIPEALCQQLQAAASEALGVDFYMQATAPFLDTIGGEAGKGCRIGASGNGAQFTSPQGVVAALVNSAGLGWTPQPNYQADGPTGSLTGLTRDMGLMLIRAEWQPDATVQCPADQPISVCSMTPEQKIYTIRVNTAMYKADFSLDGHWEDATADFSLDLYQDWKNIYGRHTTVVRGGSKVDSLDVSINGSLQGQVATVQFQSSFTSDSGTAQITYIDANTIQWKIIDAPEGEYYLPAEATLTRR